MYLYVVLVASRCFSYPIMDTRIILSDSMNKMIFVCSGLVKYKKIKDLEMKTKEKKIKRDHKETNSNQKQTSLCDGADSRGSSQRTGDLVRRSRGSIVDLVQRPGRGLHFAETFGIDVDKGIR
jgi:hypothetical protein